jgi:hypothetical protein
MEMAASGKSRWRAKRLPIEARRLHQVATYVTQAEAERAYAYSATLGESMAALLRRLLFEVIDR